MTKTFTAQITVVYQCEPGHQDNEDDIFHSHRYAVEEFYKSLYQSHFECDFKYTITADLFPSEVENAPKIEDNPVCDPYL